MVSRRLLLSLPFASVRMSAGVRGQVAPSDTRRFLDPSTENHVQRLTDPSYRSLLPRFTSRPVGSRSNVLYYSSDRLGSLQVFRMDLKSGQSKQLTEAETLLPDGFAIFPDERTFCYLDGPALHVASLSTLRNREAYRSEPGWTPVGPPLVADDGGLIAFQEQSPSGMRIQIVPLPQGGSNTVSESHGPILDLVFRPRSRQLVWKQGGDYMFQNLGVSPALPAVPLAFAPGQNSWAQFSSTGDKLLYLNRPADRTKLNTIREYDFASQSEKNVTKTSQFGAFGRNGDASVFVGASLSLASPFVLIVLRLGRELTLCEHRASNVDQVRPIFSPNSQRIFFQSDRFGKPALFSMQVEKLVEETEEA